MHRVYRVRPRRLESNRRICHGRHDRWSIESIDRGDCDRTEVLMAKSLLILMLMAMQVLAGTCGSLHLCISNDGSYCCIDAGPESCTCCHKHGEAAHNACCDEPACEAVPEKCCEHCDEESTEPDAQCIVAGDPCACTHIPLIVSSSQPTTIARSTINESIERCSLLIAWLPSLVGSDAVAPLPHLRWFEPPVVPDFALTVISTVVIRC